jgi:hypothetical protein
MRSLGNQLRHHSVALISLIVALTALAYNTWRNEQTEENRNIRTAGIELLLKLGELEQVVFLSHYDADPVRGSPRIGWAYALTIRDLGRLAPDPVTTSSRELLDVWQANWTGLGEDEATAARISSGIDRARNDVLEVLAALD